MSTPCERIIPGKVDSDLYNEHISRYLFAKQFIKEKKVLDLGCGTGYGSNVMAKVARKVVGVDISKEAIIYANEHFNTRKVSFHSEDCARLGLADKSFDVVVSFEVIEHIKDYTALIKEAKRVLTNNGIFILSTPNKKMTEEHGETNPYHIHEFYYDELEHLLKGFFGQVQILAENHCPGISISSPQCKKGDTHFPLDVNDSATDDFLKTPSYFIAVCYQHTKSVPTINRLFYIPSEANVLREKDSHIKALQEQLKEFNKHTEWATKLDAELQEKNKYLTQLKREFDERTNYVRKLTKDLEEKNRYIGKLQQEFDEKVKWVSQLDSELKKTNRVLSNLRQELDERTKWARKLDVEVKEKDRHIDKLQQEFDEKVTWASELDTELKKTNQALTNLRQELDERTEWAKTLDEGLKEKDRHIDKLQHEYDEKIKWASQLDAELKKNNQALTNLRQELDERTEWAKKLDEGLKKKDKSLEKLQQEFDEKANWASQLDSRLKESNQTLSKLRQEYDERTSWALKLDAELKKRDEHSKLLQYEIEAVTKKVEKLDAETKNKIAMLHTLNQIQQEKDQSIIQLQEDIKKKTHSEAELQRTLQSIKGTRLFRLGKKIGLIKT
jgi:SAM-dependent methyltransferase